MTIFDHLNNLTWDKRPWHKLTLEEQKTANMFMLHRFISMEYKYIQMVNEIQALNAPASYSYSLYMSLIPKKKTFFKYLKKTVKESKDQDNIEVIKKIFEISEREANEYVDLLDKKQLESFKLQLEGVKQKKK